jgi:hypothetical protein
MVKPKKRSPQNGDRVLVRGEKGTFVVYSVNSMVETVNVKLMGTDHALGSIAWDALTFLDEEDESQAAARIVREATE